MTKDNAAQNAAHRRNGAALGAQDTETQAGFDRRDAELLNDVRLEKPEARLIPAPLTPLEQPRTDQSVLLGRSLYQAPGEGWGDITPAYEPVEDGGFRLTGGKRTYNRQIIQGQNRILSGDLPVFQVQTAAGSGVYENWIKNDEKVFPLWARPDGHHGNVWPNMGTLQIGVVGADGKPAWLAPMPGLKVTTTFRPGYTHYELAAPGWTATLRIAPALDFHGLVCRIAFDRAIPLVWRFGDIYWQRKEKTPNQNVVAIDGRRARITEPNLPNGLVMAGWDGTGEGRVIAGNPAQAEFTAVTAQQVYCIAASWGVTAYDEARARVTMARLETVQSAGWPEARRRLQDSWFDAYIGRALEPEKHLEVLLSAPERELARTCDWWDQRRSEFQVQTPDRHLNALVNWERCRSDYHRQGPGMVLSAGCWEISAHISVGWYGKEWGGDHATVADHLRLHGALQEKSGAIGWIAPSLCTFMNENNTPYWVD